MSLQALLGEELALKPGSYGLESKLTELPLYLGLGVFAGGVALLFEAATAASRDAYNNFAPEPTRDGTTPFDVRPILGGITCGLLGIAVPQVLFTGYSTLNAILDAGDTPDGAHVDVVKDMLSGVLADGVLGGLGEFGALALVGLLLAKLSATAICAGSGLVGGTFAPSLFLGAVLGATYQSVTSDVLGQLGLTVSDAPAYALIGAAATLASVFQAPMTATLLVFELCRDYDLVLPLLAAAGTGPRVVQWARSRGSDANAPASQNPKPATKSTIQLVRDSPKGETRLEVDSTCEVDFLSGTCLNDKEDPDAKD